MSTTLPGEQVERMRHGLLRGDFNRALVNLVGHDLSADEIARTEAFLRGFDDPQYIEYGNRPIEILGEPV